MHNAARYTYLAIAMIEYVGAVSTGEPPLQVEGVRRGAVLFFESALRATRHSPRMSGTMLNDYDCLTLVTDTLMRADVLPEAFRRGERNTLLRSFLNLLKSIQSPRVLSKEEQTTASLLIRTLRVLYEVGAEQQSDRAMNRMCGHWHRRF